MKYGTKLWGLLLACALGAALLAGCGGSASDATGGEAQESAGTAAAGETVSPAEAGEEELEAMAEEGLAEATEAPPAEPADGETQETGEAAGNVQAAPDDSAAFDEAALLQALDDCCNVGPGAAGSSLRAMKAAGELVTFAAWNWNDGAKDAIQSRIAQWYGDLDEESAAELRAGWETVSSQAQAIAAAPWDPDILGPLEDAGLGDLPLSDMDLTHTGDLLSSIRFLLGSGEGDGSIVE